MSNCHEIYKKGKYVKLTNQAILSGQPPRNNRDLEEQANIPLSRTPYWSLLAVLAQLLDEVQAGGDGYIIFGTTKDRLSASLVIKQNGGSEGAYGPDLQALGDACQKWL